MNLLGASTAVPIIVYEYMDYDDTSSSYGSTSCSANSSTQVYYDYYRDGGDVTSQYYRPGIALPFISTSQGMPYVSEYCTQDSVDYMYIITGRLGTSNGGTQITSSFTSIFNKADIGKNIQLYSNIYMKFEPNTSSDNSLNYNKATLINNTSSTIYLHHSIIECYYFYLGTW